MHARPRRARHGIGEELHAAGRALTAGEVAGVRGWTLEAGPGREPRHRREPRPPPAGWGSWRRIAVEDVDARQARPARGPAASMAWAVTPSAPPSCPGTCVHELPAGSGTQQSSLYGSAFVDHTGSSTRPIALCRRALTELEPATMRLASRGLGYSRDLQRWMMRTIIRAAGGRGGEPARAPSRICDPVLVAAAAIYRMSPFKAWTLRSDTSC